MNTIYLSSAQQRADIALGRRGENKVTEVVFDFSSWKNEFGDGEITMLARRANDIVAYPVTLSVNGEKATWVVTSTDTAYRGCGVIEYIYTVGEKVVKSVVFGTKVLADIGEASDTPPDPYEDWLEQLLSAAKKIENNTAYLSGFLSTFSLGATKRVEGGTRILNRISAIRMCAPFGFFYDTAESKLRLYMAAAQFQAGEKYKYFVMLDKSGGDAYELTLENAPTISQLSAPETDDSYKFRVNTSFTESKTADVRFCAVAYDNDRNELGRIYSAQYRYVLNEGVVTRTRYATEKGNADEIIEVGLAYNAPSAYAMVAPKKDAVGIGLAPVVSTNQSSSWNMVVDDSVFDVARCLAVLMGDHTMYFGPTIEKAEE